MHPPISSDRTLAGIGLMLGAMFLFSINDVMGKWLVATYGVAQIMLIRSLAAGIMLAPAVRRVGFRAIFVQERLGSIFVEPFVRQQRWPFSTGL